MNNYITIPLTKGQETLIDNCDADLTEYKWFARQSNDYGFYAARNSKMINCKRGAEIKLHRVILERILQRRLDPNERVDHINLDKLDNRRENLRLATQSQNCMNKRRQSNNTSGYKGVAFHKSSGKWEARINVNGKRLYLGVFDTPELAYEEYCNAAKEYHGEFARLE